MTSSLFFPGCSHPGFVVAPSHGFRLHRSGRLVASGSSELGAAQSVYSVLSLRHILAFVRCELESPLVPSLTAARLGLWPCGLAIVTLPLVSCPWTGLCWSQLCECPFVVLPRQLVGSGVCSPASPICPTSSVVRQSAFGLSASVSRQVFAMRSPFRVESVSVLDWNEDSSSTFLVFGWSLRDEVTL